MTTIIDCYLRTATLCHSELAEEFVRRSWPNKNDNLLK